MPDPWNTHTFQHDIRHILAYFHDILLDRWDNHGTLFVQWNNQNYPFDTREDTPYSVRFSTLLKKIPRGNLHNHSFHYYNV